MSRPWKVGETGVSRCSSLVELDRLLQAAQLVGRDEQEAVVGPDEDPVRPAQRDRAPAAADLRIDDGEMDAGGHVRQRVREDERALEHLLRARSRG